MTLNAHYSAFVARLKHGILADKVDEVVRLTATGEPVRANYVVVGLDMPALRDRRLTAPQASTDFAVYTFDVRSVAVDRAGALLFAQTVRDRLLGQVLTVSGRACGPISLVEPVEEGRVQWDRTARLFYLDESYRFGSNRTS